jgi:hypothetical protein
MARTIVYIDGFNLYYRACRPSGHKWLDISALSAAVLPASAQITQINYYTARVSGRVDPTAPARQHAYLRALGRLPLVTITYGNFRTDTKWSGLVQPPTFRPTFPLPAGAAPQVAYMWKTEEKGSDVNLGVHLVRDAYIHAFDEAAVLTNDTDLTEPLRIVTQEVGLPVTLLVPSSQPSASLVAVASHVRHIQPYLGPCLFPDPVTLPGGRTVAKPASW